MLRQKKQSLRKPNLKNLMLLRNSLKRRLNKKKR